MLVNCCSPALVILTGFDWIGTLFARREEPSCVRDLAWPGGLSEKDKRGPWQPSSSFHMLTLFIPVVLESWQKEFKGKPDALESVIRTYLDPTKGPPRYARYAAVTQSSGTGKSRMVDELAKTILCLPLNFGSHGLSRILYSSSGR